MSTKLSDLQQRVVDVLPPNKDVAIVDIYSAAYPERMSGDLFEVAVRDMQQQLGPLIARINEKLKRGKIVPGDLKQTYRLDTRTPQV